MGTFSIPQNLTLVSELLQVVTSEKALVFKFKFSLIKLQLCHSIILPLVLFVLSAVGSHRDCWLQSI